MPARELILLATDGILPKFLVRFRQILHDPALRSSTIRRGKFSKAIFSAKAFRR